LKSLSSTDDDFIVLNDEGILKRSSS